MYSSAGFKPFMEYAGSYALYNYRLVDPSKGLEYDNLRLIRAFERGLDPKSSEAGFVQVHIDMVQNSGPLVEGVVDALDGCASDDREVVNDGLRKVISAMTKINKVMETMWDKSKPNDYDMFRTFIFGIQKQTMFPHGVIYEGVSEEPLEFRGESGANDSMVSAHILFRSQVLGNQLQTDPIMRQPPPDRHARHTPYRDPPRFQNLPPRKSSCLP
jgi:indoleamine 2,3-dioxygenase